MPAKAGIQYAASSRLKKLTSRSTGSSAFADDDGCGRSPRPSISLLQILLHLLAQIVAQIRARHAEGDVGAQESRLRAAIVAFAFELDTVETLLFGQPDHGVGELDLAAGAALLRFQDFENFRLQDVAPGDRQIRGRGALGRLFHHAVDLEHLAVRVALADAADAVLMRQMR